MDLMEKIEKRNPKLVIIINICIYALYLFLPCFFLIQNCIKASNYKTTEAVIVDSATRSAINKNSSNYEDDDWDSDFFLPVYVNYKVDGIEYYHVKVSGVFFNYYFGKNITINYNPNNPTDIKCYSHVNISLIAILIIVLTTLIFNFLIYTLIKRRKQSKEHFKEESFNNLDDKELNEIGNSYNKELSKSKRKTKKINLYKLIICFIHVAIGFSLLVVGIIGTVDFNNTAKKYEKVEATVVYSSTNNIHNTTNLVSFKLNNILYENVQLHKNFGYKDVGTTLTIYCKTDDPNTILYEEPENGDIFLIILGSLLFAIPGIVLIFLTKNTFKKINTHKEINQIKT